MAKKTTTDKKATAAAKDLVEAPASDAAKLPTEDEQKQELQNQIAEAVRNVKKTASDLGTQKEVVGELYDKLPASSRVAKLEAELEEAKKELNVQALESKELEKAKESLADVKSLNKHYSAVLSMLLIQWAHKFSRRDVTVEDQRREIIISAKLGEVVDELQSELPLWEITE